MPRHLCATCRNLFKRFKLSKDTGECKACYKLTCQVAHALRESPLQAFRRRDISHDRTPYYVPDCPERVYTSLEGIRALFIQEHGRDYQGDDDQFVDSSGTFTEALAVAMELSNHHPAHIYAVRTTKLLIHDRNFRDVPQEWTERWQEATKQYEKWAGAVKDRADPDKAFITN